MMHIKTITFELHSMILSYKETMKMVDNFFQEVNTFIILKRTILVIKVYVNGILGITSSRCAHETGPKKLLFDSTHMDDSCLAVLFNVQRT